MNTRIIAVANQKGGVGKTTTSVALATGLRQQGFKTLLIDTDSQCNATDTYRAAIEGTATLYDLLFSNEPVLNCIQHTEAGDIIACDPLLREAEQRFPQDQSRSFILKERCQALIGLYDYIIIDTPPSIGVILSNVLTFAKEVIIPITCARFAISGINLLKNTIDSIRRYTNPKLHINGLVLVMYNKQLRICKEIEQGLPAVADYLGTKIYPVKIRSTTACNESQSAREPIYSYAPMCNTALDYMKLCDKIRREKGKWRNANPTDSTASTWCLQDR